MGRSGGDGKMVDGGSISGTVISDMVASRRGDIGDGRMTSTVVVAGAITSDIVGSIRGDISDDGEVTCGVVVSSRQSRGDGRLVDSGVVSSIMTSGIVASMRGNTGDGRVVSNMTCSKGEGGSMEASSANGVDDVDGANMVSGGCIDRRGCRLAHPPSLLPRPQIGYILAVMADTGGLMDGYDDVGD
uniref:Uncharacterized protein n=1 Tax=Vitis vinifera TaxID=29760 RepID=A5ADK6_VITVI|nr:hypothetical protein VITISV_006920 [Vitis vinifera]